MAILVRYLSTVRVKTGLREEAVILPEGSTLQDLVDHLNAGHGLSLPKSEVMILLGGRGWRQLSLKMATVLHEGQVVTLAPVVEGG